MFKKIMLQSLDNFKENLLGRYYTKSYSQEGEDMVLKRILKKSNGGFYVDVGSHHPKRFSNTYYFYKNGWTGINIDGMPGIKTIFDKYRPNDINIEAIISDSKKEVLYYMFKDHAFNTINKEIAENRIKRNIELIDKKFVQTQTLKDILDRYIKINKEIDFLSIDIEGIDVQVVKTNDFEKYRPKLILFEVLKKDIFSLIENESIFEWMRSKDYLFFSKTVNTLFFIEKTFYNKRFKM